MEHANRSRRAIERRTLSLVILGLLGVSLAVALPPQPEAVYGQTGSPITPLRGEPAWLSGVMSEAIAGYVSFSGGPIPFRLAPERSVMHVDAGTGQVLVVAPPAELTYDPVRGVTPDSVIAFIGLVGATPLPIPRTVDLEGFFLLQAGSDGSTADLIDSAGAIVASLPLIVTGDPGQIWNPSAYILPQPGGKLIIGVGQWTFGGFSGALCSAIPVVLP